MGYKYEKTAVITGAASGIGRALAVAWAERGWKLGIVDIDMDRAENTLEMVEQAGGTGEVFRCNVGSLEEVETMANHFFDTWGEVGVLVNNAGVGALGCVGDIPIEEWERIIGIDLWGAIYGCHAFIPRMKEQGGGHIVNTASMAGLISTPWAAPYNMAKAAVISLSETLKAELAPFNIGVTVVCPMVTRTGFLDNMTSTDDWEMEIGRIAMDNVRLTTEEVAAKIVRGVGKNRLYVIPQTSAKTFWLQKRLSPSLVFGLAAFLNKRGLLRPIYSLMARRGWA